MRGKSARVESAIADSRRNNFPSVSITDRDHPDFLGSVETFGFVSALCGAGLMCTVGNGGNRSLE
jgi:hypothetical protein